MLTTFVFALAIAVAMAQWSGGFPGNGIPFHGNGDNLPPGFETEGVEVNAARGFGNTDCRDLTPACSSWRFWCGAYRGLWKYCPLTCNRCRGGGGGSWSPWKYGSCSKTCGGGSQRGTRTCIGGSSCPGSSTTSKSCNAQACPTGCKDDNPRCTILRLSCSVTFVQAMCKKTCGKCSTPRTGKWNKWSSFGRCSRTCGGGIQTRKRTCKTTPCAGSSTNTRNCNTRACEGWGKWSSYGKCNKSCGGGIQSRTRTCKGGSCPGSAKGTRNCNTHKCKWGKWSSYDRCSKTCGSGTQTRTRTCNGGGCSGSSKQTRNCNTQKCNTGGGSGSGSCSKSCGYGVKKTRVTSGGQSYDKYEWCNKQACPSKSCPNSQYKRFSNDPENRCCKLSSSTCGANVYFGSRVIGGSRSDKDEFPWQVFIDPSNCGGVLISSTLVLTAGHCLHSGKNYDIPRPANILAVIAGQKTITQYQRTNAVRNVLKWRKHPSYDYPAYDIAVVKMRTAYSINNEIRPACLPPASFKVPEDTTCIVSGFGVVNNNNWQLSNNLMDAPLEVFNMGVCKTGYMGSKESATVNKHANKLICAGSLDGTVDSCAGDSGSGLVCQMPNSCAFHVVGLVSFGPTPCAHTTRPGIYTNVMYYRSWIDQQIRDY